MCPVRILGHMLGFFIKPAGYAKIAEALVKFPLQLSRAFTHSLANLQERKKKFILRRNVQHAEAFHNPIPAKKYAFPFVLTALVCNDGHLCHYGRLSFRQQHLVDSRSRPAICGFFQLLSHYLIVRSFRPFRSQNHSAARCWACGLTI